MSQLQQCGQSIQAMHDRLYLIIAICSKCQKTKKYHYFLEIPAKTRPSELDPDDVSITNSLIMFPSPIFANSFMKVSVSTNPECFPNLLRLLIPNTIVRSLLWYRSVSSLCYPSRRCKSSLCYPSKSRFATSSCFKNWGKYFLISIWFRIYLAAYSTKSMSSPLQVLPVSET